METTVDAGDGLGHFIMLGTKFQTTMVLLGWALCLVTTLVVLLLYHYWYSL
jgi:hypothetical protein